MCSVTLHDQEYPDEGAITVSWRVSVIDGRRRIGWEFASEPRIDQRLATELLRDVAMELEEDLPTP
jgi:hypothetical protein